MRREVILAIAIGFSLGLLLAAGLLFGRKTIRHGVKLPLSIQRQAEKPSFSEPSPPPISPISSISPITLTITSPQDESIFDKDKLTLEGKTNPEAVVSVIYEEGETLGEANENGDFDFEIPLIGGANEITVTAYNLEGEEATEMITVVYTTAEI